MPDRNSYSVNRLAVRQRGVGSLAISAVLLLAASIVVLYLNRSLIFEQRTSANQFRSASAHEIAEAGLEWAIGKLNQLGPMDTSCDPSSGALTPSFRLSYAADTSAGTLPSCAVQGADDGNPAGSLNCSCPAAGHGAPDRSGSRGHFTVRFEKEAGGAGMEADAWDIVRITAIACVGETTGVCTPPGPDAAPNSFDADAMAIASVAVKLRPLMLAAPAAPLTCGGKCVLGGSFNLYNTSVASNGLLMYGGETPDFGNANLGDSRTIPGQPVQTAVAQDSQLAELKHDAESNPTDQKKQLCGAYSTVFRHYFGMDLVDFINSPTTEVIDNSDLTSQKDIIQQIKDAHAKGKRSFYFSGMAYFQNNDFQNNTFGSESDPVVIVTEAGIDSKTFINGIIFSNNPYTNLKGLGNVIYNGAVILCDNIQKDNSNATISFNEKIIKDTGPKNGIMIKIPGSWRDWDPRS